MYLILRFASLRPTHECSRPLCASLRPVRFVWFVLIQFSGFGPFLLNSFSLSITRAWGSVVTSPIRRSRYRFLPNQAMMHGERAVFRFLLLLLLGARVLHRSDRGARGTRQSTGTWQNIMCRVRIRKLVATCVATVRRFATISTRRFSCS